MSKKLIYVLNSYTENEASHFAHLVHLLNEMTNQGCIITLIIEKMGAKPDVNSSAIEVIGLSHRTPFIRHIELFFVILNLIKKGYSRSFYRINAPACIVGALAHRLLGGKTYLWQSGTTHEIDQQQPFSRKKIKWLFGSYVPTKLARSMTTHFVTGPEAMIDYYAQVVGIRRDKILLLYNDIQIDRFDRMNRAQAKAAYLDRHNLPSDTTILLIVHRLSPVRRTLDYLRPLLRTLADRAIQEPWRLIIAGGGSELAHAIELAKETNTSDRVEFLGDVANRDLPAIYAQADIFLQPSYTEGFPRVLLEAMASGLPIVTTDAGGTPQLLGTRQMNFITKKEIPNDFTKRTIELMDRQSEWEDLARENKIHVERFATPVVAKMYMETIFS